jgi:hypothetical protein
VNTREAGLPRPSGRTEKRAGAAPDDPLFIGRAPKPDQTIDLKARPHLTIGSRNRSGLLRRKTTPHRSPSVSLDMDADPSGLGVHSQRDSGYRVTPIRDIRNRRSDVRSCGSRARTG